MSDAVCAWYAARMVLMYRFSLAISGFRSNSMSYPPLPAAGLRRADSASGSFSGSRGGRPDWVRNWDSIKHEDAITSSSFE